MSKGPYLDRDVLIKDIEGFAASFNAVFKQNAHRMSDYYEMAVYNQIVMYYRRRRFDTAPQNLHGGAFRYRLSPTALLSSASYFQATAKASSEAVALLESVEIHHNLKVQSAHHDHLYYSADVSVCRYGGVVTQKQNSGRKHSYISNSALLTFFEVKNLNPFPELLFSFSGLILEFCPWLIDLKGIEVRRIQGSEHLEESHLASGIAVSGQPSVYCRTVIEELRKRYHHNIVLGLAETKGRFKTYNGLTEYRRVKT